MDDLGWVDYAAILVALVIPGIISLYFGLMTPSSKPPGVKRHLGLFPAFMSLTASTISGVSMIGMPSEVYLNGIIFCAYLVTADSISALLNNLLFMPVLYNLQIESSYEYFQLRFDQRVRKLASVIYIISQISYAAVAAYPPATIISQYVSIYTSAQGLAIFCSICTLVGGFKGVVWTDTFQTIIMWIFIMVFIYLGLIQGGGLANIYNVSEKTGRLDSIIMDLDPTLRMSFWSGIFGITTLSLTYSVLNPSSFQRYNMLKSERTARWAAVLNALQIILINVLLSFCGLGMYASFHECDPKLAGLVDNYLNSVVLFVSQGSKIITGIKGLFIAGILSGSLSTMSTNLNTAATILYTEFVKNWAMASGMTDTKCIRLLSCLAGMLSMSVLFLARGTNSIMEIFQLFIGGIGGLSVGLYALGMFCLPANSKGTLWGGSISLGLMSSLAVGSRLYASDWMGSPYKPLTTNGCSFNVSSPNSEPKLPFTQTNTVPWIFRITPNYYPFIAACLTVALGLLFSKITARLSDQREKLKKELFCPLLRNWFRDRFYQEIPLNEIIGNAKTT